jgi:UDP-glucose 4-epimerase
MRTLVTGGAGFIGSTLVDRLLSEGHEVVVIDNLASGKLSNLESARTNYGERLTFHEEDIRNPEAVELILTAKPEIVFHLAAQMDVRRSVSDPVYDASVNVIGALHVLEGARGAGARKVVFASSGGTIYGDAPDELLPLDENAPQQPLSPYGITKKVFGDYLFAYKELHGLDYVALALGNIFGPRQDPHGEAGVVAIFGKRLLAGDQCKIFGDGSATRDYVYVDDTVDAFVRAASAGTGIYNIGTGMETSTKELYFAMAAAAGVDQQPEYAPARVGELQRSVLNSAKARAELGWEPKVTVADGSKNVLDHIRQFG